MKGLLCIFIGHHWVQPTESHEVYPVFECQRCKLVHEFAPGTVDTAHDARLDAETSIARDRIGDGDH